MRTGTGALLLTTLLFGVPASAHARLTISFYSEAIIIATDETRTGPVDLPREIGPAINACWHPPHEGDEITFRMSFKRDGSVFGKPRITYFKTVEGAGGEAVLANSIRAAIAKCAPLPFTPQLGATIAGRVFLIHLIAPQRQQRT